MKVLRDEEKMLKGKREFAIKSRICVSKGGKGRALKKTTKPLVAFCLNVKITIIVLN